MSTANLKIDLINRITQVQDSGIIKDLQRLLDFEMNEGVFKTTPDQKKRIVEAKAEIKQSKIISEVSANKEIQEWLSK
jgi:hypothetical protein